MNYSKTNAGSITMLEPVGIRIYLIKDQIMQCMNATQLCSPNFLSFETSLRKSLTGHLVIEAESKRKRPSWDLCPKTIDIPSTVEIIDSKLFWSFKDQMFLKNKGPCISVNINPSILVSDATNTWYDLVLSQTLSIMSSHQQRRRAVMPDSSIDLFVAHNVILVLTHKPECWTTASIGLNVPCELLQSRGLQVSKLAGPLVVLASPEAVLQNLQNSCDLDDLVKHIFSQCMLPETCFTQRRRIILNSLCAKFESFVLPIDFIQFGTMIVDDAEAFKQQGIVDLLTFKDNCRYLKLVNIFKNNTMTKPKGLTWHQTKIAAYDFPQEWSLSFLAQSMEAHTQIIPINKSILKKFRVVGHSIKPTIFEDRIGNLFQSGLLPGILHKDALQRFSGKPVPLEKAEELIYSHFKATRKSFGSYKIDDETPDLNESFVLKTLKADDKNCCICFETNDSLGLSICGHVYCEECIKQHFHVEWSQNNYKECAQCRCALMLADFFFVKAFTNEIFVEVQSSEKLAINNFLSSLRSKTGLDYWTPNFQRQAVELKHLVIEDLGTARPMDIIKSLWTNSTSIMLHVFFNEKDRGLYNAFLSSF